MRLAWFTPLEPVRSGIATYSAMILPALAGWHGIDVFVDLPVWRARADAAVRGGDGYWSVESMSCQVRSAHDFLPRHALAPYDLVVYQLGNAACHDYMWPYLVRHPGLLVLHDWQVHHARARFLLQHARAADYKAEFGSCHPGAPAGVADWVISGVGNMAAYVWPLTGDVVRASRAVAVHFPRVAQSLAGLHPDAEVFTVRHGAPDLAAGEQTSVDARSAEAPELSSDDGTHGLKPVGYVEEPPVVFAAFGLVTPEKRIPQILRALAAIRTVAPRVRLKLVGDAAAHYDVRADAEQLGVADLIDVTGFVSDQDFDRHIVSSDVCLCLRWPTNREASGPWLRCLAAGKPTVINDLIHLVDLPTFDPRTWQIASAPADAAALTPPGVDDAVAVAIDILDEDHSLMLAMRRLALDADLRARLGKAARRVWTAGHTLAAMTADYERVITAAASLPVRPPSTRGLPSHLLADGTDTARRLADELGVAVDFLR